MAKMGRRKITGAKVLSNPSDKPFVGIGHMAVNLITGSIEIHTIVAQGFELPVFGSPIMREGFITETGLLVGS
jgi:hypothetical protein